MACLNNTRITLFKRDKNIGNCLDKCIPNKGSKRNFLMRTRSMQNISFHSQREENIGTQAILQGQFHLYLSQCHPLIACTLCKKLCIGKTGRRLGDWFREHLRDVGKDDKDASKPVARHLISPIILSNIRQSAASPSLHKGSQESRKTLEHKFNFQIGTLNPHDMNVRFSFNIVVFNVTRHQPEG